MSVEILTQYVPVIGSVLYATFGFAKASVDGQPFDGTKFARAVGIGLVANTGAVLAGLPLEASLGLVPFATVVVDQIVSAITKRIRKRAKEEVLAELEALEADETEEEEV